MSEEFRWFTNVVSKQFWAAYSMLNGHYVAIATVVLVVVLSFMLPDISQKIHASKELKTMKKALDLMSAEINQAEAACLTVADEICCLHCSMNDDSTETVSIRPKKCGIFRSAPVVACIQRNLNQFKSRKKSVSFAESSYPKEIHRTRKSQSCRTSIPIHSTKSIEDTSGL